MPPTVIYEMNSEEKIVPIGLEQASSAVLMPLKPIAGSAVETCGFHSATVER